VVFVVVNGSFGGDGGVGVFVVVLVVVMFFVVSLL